MKRYLGIDCGSVSIKFAVLEGDILTDKIYLRNQGLINTIKDGLSMVDNDFAGVGVTGSGKEFVKSLVGADYVDSEIIAHLVACLEQYPDVKTILDIGGEDSKLMLVKDGTLSGFQMNRDCVLPSDKVITDDFTPREIKEIKINDRVLTHNGRFRPVTRVIKREHHNAIYHIDCGGLNKVNITENHPIFVIKRKQIQCYESKTRGIQVCNPTRQCYNKCKKGKKIDFEPQFLTPDKVHKGDYLILTRPNPRFSDNSLSPDFLRFLGYYLAEGNVEYNYPRVKRNGGVKKNQGIKYEAGVGLCFNIAEEKYINDTMAILQNIGLHPKYKPASHNRGIIKTYNSDFARTVKSLCGEYSHRKRLSAKLLKMDKSLLMNVILGLFRGDGHLATNNRKRTLVLKTASEVLASQVSYILLSNNIKNTITISNQNNRKPAYMVNVNGSEINKIDEHIEVLSQRNRKPMTCEYGYLVRINSINKEHYNGDVYNLAVEGDNSYVCNHLAVHNCGGGTGAMIETIAARLGLAIEDAGTIALESEEPASLPGKCGIFCQSAVVSELNKGRPLADIMMGVCKALVGNYLAVLAKGKRLLAPIIFQGATALNPALVKCFQEELGTDIYVPENCSFMGAIGIAMLTQENMDGKTSYRGPEILTSEYETKITHCDGCENMCELLSLFGNGNLLGVSGSRCGEKNK